MMDTKLTATFFYCLYVSFVGRITRSAGLFNATESVFLEQPESITVYESDIATFHCSLTDSFHIFWQVNNSDAAYTKFRQRGVSIIPFNMTSSRLEIVGYRSNNNTLVHCAALEYHSNAWIPSETALLIILARSTDLTTHVTSSPVDTCSESLAAKGISLATVYHQTSPSPTADGSNSETTSSLLLGAGLSCAVLLVFVIVTAALVSLIITKRLRNKRGHVNATSDIQIQKNAVYEYSYPIHCQHNNAYEDVMLHQ